jgi:hypothetical protein
MLCIESKKKRTNEEVEKYVKPDFGLRPIE